MISRHIQHKVRKGQLGSQMTLEPSRIGKVQKGRAYICIRPPFGPSALSCGPNKVASSFGPFDNDLHKPDEL